MPRKTYAPKRNTRPRNDAHGSTKTASAIASALRDLRAEDASHPRFIARKASTP